MLKPEGLYRKESRKRVAVIIATRGFTDAASFTLLRVKAEEVLSTMPDDIFSVDRGVQKEAKPGKRGSCNPTRGRYATCDGMLIYVCRFEEVVVRRY